MDDAAPSHIKTYEVYGGRRKQKCPALEIQIGACPYSEKQRYQSDRPRQVFLNLDDTFQKEKGITIVHVHAEANQQAPNVVMCVGIMLL